MGFLSKIWKGVKKVVKKIGKGIKKVAMKVGKFMNKIGIVGQIALGLLLPGIGTALGAWAGTASTNIFAAAAKGFVNAAIQVGTKVGSVFKTVTQGVTKVIGETVGAVINKIPGASDLIQNVTGKLGVNAGAGIDISGKTFTTAFETAGQAITDTLSAGQDLFSMDTLVGKNKYYLESMKSKIAEAIPTSGEFSKQGINSLELSKPQMSGLTDGDTTNLFTDTTATATQGVGPLKDGLVTATQGVGPLKDGFVPSQPSSLLAEASTSAATTDIGPLQKGYEYAKDKFGSAVTDTVDNTFSTLTDLPSNLIKKQAGLIGPAKEGNVYQSNVGASAGFQLADSTITGTQAFQSAMQNNSVLGFFGNPSLVYNAEQETANFMRNQQRGGF